MARLRPEKQGSMQASTPTHIVTLAVDKLSRHCHENRTLLFVMSDRVLSYKVAGWLHSIGTCVLSTDVLEPIPIKPHLGPMRITGHMVIRGAKQSNKAT